MLHLYIIGGCNGAGKTTTSFTLLPEILHCKEFINADNIAYGLSPFNPEGMAFEAGRIMLKRMHQLLGKGVDFAFETTLATRSYAPFIRKAREQGYKVTLLFLWLRSPAMAAERVATRVAKGGHNIPPDVIERRYYRGIKNLRDLYMPLCDEWTVVDNTGLPAIIADNKNGFKQTRDETGGWNTITEQLSGVEEDAAFYHAGFSGKIGKGLQKAYNRLVQESAARGESLVVFRDGRVQHIPARELLDRLPAHK